MVKPSAKRLFFTHVSPMMTLLRDTSITWWLVFTMYIVYSTHAILYPYIKKAAMSTANQLVIETRSCRVKLFKARWDSIKSATYRDSTLSSSIPSLFAKRSNIHRTTVNKTPSSSLLPLHNDCISSIVVDSNSDAERSDTNIIHISQRLSLIGNYAEFIVYTLRIAKQMCVKENRD